jgi:hypothetical protein
MINFSKDTATCMSCRKRFNVDVLLRVCFVDESARFFLCRCCAARQAGFDVVGKYI